MKMPNLPSPFASPLKTTPVPQTAAPGAEQAQKPLKIGELLESHRPFVWPTTFQLGAGFSHLTPLVHNPMRYSNPYYDLVLDEFWLMGQLDDPALAPAEGQWPPFRVGVQILRNGDVWLPTLANYPMPVDPDNFGAPPDRNLYLSWMHPTRQWINYVNAPLRIRNGDSLNISQFNESAVQIDVLFVVKGHYEKLQ